MAKITFTNNQYSVELPANPSPEDLETHRKYHGAEVLRGPVGILEAIRRVNWGLSPYPD